MKNEQNQASAATPSQKFTGDFDFVRLFTKREIAQIPGFSVRTIDIAKSARVFKRLDAAMNHAVDCWQEANTNLTRKEWTLAGEHFRKLFRNTDTIRQCRKETLRQLRLARWESGAR